MENKKPRRNQIDCSTKKDNNPTKLLQIESPRLKEIESLSELKEEMTKIVEDSAISTKNLAKFRETRDQIETLEEMQRYLYNFILSGSAMSVNF